MAQTHNTGSRLKSIISAMECSAGTAQDRRNQYWFIGWCVAWAVFFTAGNQLLKAAYQLSEPVTWIIAAVPIAIGIGAVLSYMKLVRMADELIQKIQLEGLAVGFGVGIVFTLSYQILERAGAPHLEIDDAALVLMGGWMLGQVLAFLRYR